MRSRLSNLLWGLFFIIIGIGFAGNVFDLWNFNLFFSGWWTLFIIIPCAISMIQGGVHTGNSIGLIVGLMLLSSCQGFFNIRIVGQLIIPVILIIIGLGIIFANTLQKNRHYNSYYGNNSGNGESYDSAQYGSYDSDYQKDAGKSYNESMHATGDNVHTAAFSSVNLNYDNEIFHGCTANAYFGATTLHLENAIINENTTIYCTATFGGIEIFLPSYVNVKVNSTPIFGGVSSRRAYSNNSDAPVVFVNATCLFGGVELK